MLDEVADEKLPDMRNIQHKGYLVTSKARIAGARSVIYRSLKIKGRFHLPNLRKAWVEIIKLAREIPNIADRVFVENMVGKELFQHDPERAKSMLFEADELLEAIPTLVGQVTADGRNTSDIRALGSN